jgi:hypothetical protein
METFSIDGFGITEKKYPRTELKTKLKSTSQLRDVLNTILHSQLQFYHFQANIRFEVFFYIFYFFDLSIAVEGYL